MKTLKDCLRIKNNVTINESSNVKIDCTIKREPIETVINVKCYKYETEDDDTFDMTSKEEKHIFAKTSYFAEELEKNLIIRSIYDIGN